MVYSYRCVSWLLSFVLFGILMLIWNSVNLSCWPLWELQPFVVSLFLMHDQWTEREIFSCWKDSFGYFPHSHLLFSWTVLWNILLQKKNSIHYFARNILIFYFQYLLKATFVQRQKTFTNILNENLINASLFTITFWLLIMRNCRSQKSFSKQS